MNEQTPSPPPTSFTPPDVPFLPPDAVADTSGPHAALPILTAPIASQPSAAGEPVTTTATTSSSNKTIGTNTSTTPPSEPKTSLGAGTTPSNTGLPHLPSSSSASGSNVFSTLMLLVALVALVLSGMLWQRLDRIQQELARQSAEALKLSNEAKTVADTSETQNTELQARLSVAEVKLSEVSLQRSQLEELMLSVSRSRDDTLVMDIESGIRLAMQQAELTGSTQALVAALQAADKRIARAAQPRLNPVQRALARDIERVQTAAVVDVAAMALRLDELARLVDELPLRNAAPSNRRLNPKPTGSPQAPVATPAPTGTATTVNTSSTPPPAPPSNSTPVALDPTGEPLADAVGIVPAPSTPLTDSNTPPSTTDTTPASNTAQTRKPKPKTPLPPSTEAPAEETWLTKVQVQWRKFWERVVQDVSVGSRDLVRVSRIDEPDAILLAPEQGFFLRENLKLKLLNARLSLLSRQVPSARADLMAARAALQKYFDPQAINTRQAVQLLGDVLQGTKTVVLPRPDETLTALAKAAGGR